MRNYNINNNSNNNMNSMRNNNQANSNEVKCASVQEYNDSDFKNGRTSRAINHYNPRPTSLLTANSLIPKLEELLHSEIDAISHRERILASVPRAGRPVLYVRKTRGTVYYSLRYPNKKGISSDNRHNTSNNGKANPSNSHSNPDNGQTNPDSLHINPNTGQTNPGNTHNRPAILQDDTAKEIYITKSPARVLNYLNLELSEAAIAQHRNNRDILQSVIESLKSREVDEQASPQCTALNRKLETLPLRGLLPEFLNWSEAKINWALTKYTTNPYYLDELRYQSKCGLWVRTKAEERIADALSDHHILFRYEPALSFDGITKYPDFVIWTRGGRIVIWEHRGAQHIDSYRANEPLLISWYEQQGFTGLSTLIITHEDDIRTPEQINSIIQRFLLA